MIWLLDSDICSAHVKGEHSVRQRLSAGAGQLAVSTLTAGELLTWGHRRRAARGRLRAIESLLTTVSILPIDESVARRFAVLRAAQLDAGQKTPVLDLFIAATAIEHGLTLVTHNTKDFAVVAGIALEDWLTP
jgi:tRNA(fMet)-specific endonuclease VapC